MNLDSKGWFQFASRCWRPFQQWGFAVAAVSYAFRAVLGYGFDIPVFASLCAAAGAGYISRGLEKHGKVKAIAKYAPSILGKTT